MAASRGFTSGKWGSLASVPLALRARDFLQFGFAKHRKSPAGKIWENGRRISQRILMANFSRELFGLIFPGLQAPQKFTPKIHAQKRRHSSPIHFLEPSMSSQQFSAYGGDRQIARFLSASRSVCYSESGRRNPTYRSSWGSLFSIKHPPRQVLNYNGN